VIWGRPAHHNQPAATPADVTLIQKWLCGSQHSLLV
jgi:hypothetical protein